MNKRKVIKLLSNSKVVKVKNVRVNGKVLKKMLATSHRVASSGDEASQPQNSSKK